VGEACEQLQLRPPDVVEGMDTAGPLLAERPYSLIFAEAAQARAVLETLVELESSAALIVLGSRLTAVDGFELALHGADAVLQEPVDAAALIECMERVLHGPTAVSRLAASLVGRSGLKDVQHAIRHAMFLSALDRTHGNRHAAARMLRINRRAVQIVAKELADDHGQDAAPARLPGVRPLLRTPLPDSEEDVRRQVHRRVDWLAPGVILWRELPVQSPVSVDQVFERVRQLAGNEPFNLIVDLTSASYPPESVRARLREGFRSLPNVGRVAIYAGENDVLGLAARFVLTPTEGWDVSIHEDFAVACDATGVR
jgi:hypothetical protein